MPAGLRTAATKSRMNAVDRLVVEDPGQQLALEASRHVAPVAAHGLQPHQVELPVPSGPTRPA